MKDKNGLSELDRQLFRDSVGEVKSISHDRHVRRPRRAPPVPRQTRLDELQVLQELGSFEYDPADLETGEELLYRHPGVRPGTLRKLRRGQYSIQAECDLHGMNVESARREIFAFISHSQVRQLGCIKIIHGKGLRSRAGGPRLKALTDHLLRRHPAVMAFASAPANNGGTGAVCVLIRKKPRIAAQDPA